uniref:Uncharacterized protein n=1 Tax=Rhizophora mucronata TaxID=61149 RepID=A0A2P2PDP0_RHIMU
MEALISKHGNIMWELFVVLNYIFCSLIIC